MWTVVRALVLRWALARTFGGVLAALAVVLLPLAALLKLVGLPLLVVLGIVALPVALLLAVIGLPLLLVAGTVALLVALAGMVVTLGVLAIKIALPIVLLVWLVRWLRRPGRADRGDEPAVV